MNPPRRRALASLLLGLAVFTAGCGGAATTDSLDMTATASAAPASGAELSPAEFAAAMNRPGTILLDVRTPEEFAEGHLPGAVNLNVEDPGFAQGLAQLEKSAPYAVYCRSGNRSGVALDLMADAGFTGAYHLGGGIKAWSAEGGEVVTD